MAKFVRTGFEGPWSRITQDKVLFDTWYWYQGVRYLINRPCEMNFITQSNGRNIRASTISELRVTQGAKSKNANGYGTILTCSTNNYSPSIRFMIRENPSLVNGFGATFGCYKHFRSSTSIYRFSSIQIYDNTQTQPFTGFHTELYGQYLRISRTIGTQYIDQNGDHHDLQAANTARYTILATVSTDFPWNSFDTVHHFRCGISNTGIITAGVDNWQISVQTDITDLANSSFGDDPQPQSVVNVNWISVAGLAYSSTYPNGNGMDDLAINDNTGTTDIGIPPVISCVVDVSGAVSSNYSNNSSLTSFGSVTYSDAIGKGVITSNIDVNNIPNNANLGDIQAINTVMYGFSQIGVAKSIVVGIDNTAVNLTGSDIGRTIHLPTSARNSARVTQINSGSLGTLANFNPGTISMIITTQ